MGDVESMRTDGALERLVPRGSRSALGFFEEPASFLPCRLLVPCTFTSSVTGINMRRILGGGGGTPPPD